MKFIILKNEKTKGVYMNLFQNKFNAVKFFRNKGEQV